MAHSNETWDLDDPAVDQAINRVLTAERLAHAEVNRCRDEAQRLRIAADEQAKQIVARAEGRIKRCQRIADQSIARALEEIQMAPSASVQEASQRERERLVTVLEILADEIIGLRQ